MPYQAFKELEQQISLIPWISFSELISLTIAIGLRKRVQEFSAVALAKKELSAVALAKEELSAVALAKEENDFYHRLQKNSQMC